MRHLFFLTCCWHLVLLVSFILACTNRGWTQETSPTSRIDALLAEGARDRLTRERETLAKDLFKGLPVGSPASKQAADEVVSHLTTIARNKTVDIIKSVNAALLLGELQGPQQQLLAAATPALEKIVLDDTVTPAVRVAAMRGLSARGEALRSRSAGDTARKQATALLPTLTAVCMLGNDSLSPAGRNWLQERTLDLAADLVGLIGEDKAVLRPLQAAVVALLEDASRPINLRVRAATVVKALALSGIELPIKTTSEQITEIALAAVRDDWDAIERQKLEDMLSGTAGQDVATMLGPTGEPLENETGYLPEARCLQTSWRLVCLAAAIDGLADGLTDGNDQLKNEAAALRRLGLDIYESPKDKTVLAAIKKLIPEAAAKLKAEEERTPTSGGFTPFELN